MFLAQAPTFREGEEEGGSHGVRPREVGQRCPRTEEEPRPSEGSAKSRRKSMAELESEAYWLEPGWGAGRPHFPPGPGVSWLFPLMLPGAAGDWTEGVSGCLSSSVISHPRSPARMKLWGSSIHHLLPTEWGSGCLLPHPSPHLKAVRDGKTHSWSSCHGPQSPKARGRRATRGALRGVYWEP